MSIASVRSDIVILQYGALKFDKSSLNQQSELTRLWVGDNMRVTHGWSFSHGHVFIHQVKKGDAAAQYQKHAAF
jgi:hypothetical protein